MRSRIKQLFAGILCASVIVGSINAGGIASWATTSTKKPDQIATASNATKSPVSEEKETLIYATSNNASPRQAQIKGKEKLTVYDSLYEYHYTTSDGIEIILEAESSNWPEDITVKIEKVTGINHTKIEEELVKSLQEENKKILKSYAYDISFWSEGKEIEPDGEVKVTFKLSEADEFKEAVIFHVSDGYETVDVLPADKKSQREISCEADGFSVYGVAVLSSEDPIAIYTRDDLRNINSDLTADYILMNDLDLSSWGNWEPIGNGVGYNGTPFTGNFDGNGHTISGLSINVSGDTGSSNKGLFGEINRGSVKNLIISNAKVTGIASHAVNVGIVAGYGGTISECSVDGSIDITTSTYGSISSYNNVGGLVGVNNSTLTSCHSDVSVVVKQEAKDVLRVGGIAGSNHGTILRTINNGNVKVTSENTYGYSVDVGGIAGTGSGGAEQCANYGMINIDLESIDDSNIVNWGPRLETCIGGIQGVSNSLVKDCYNAGKISIRGLCENTGKKGLASIYVHGGGILGNSTKATVRNCYNLGQIDREIEALSPNETQDIREIYIGSIIGYQYSGNGGNCYYIGRQDKGIGYVGDNASAVSPCIALSNTEMQKEESFAGFDFQSVWKMGEGDYLYPIFLWQEETGSPDIPDEATPLTLISVIPPNNAKGVKTTDTIILEFNKGIFSSYEAGEEMAICIKDYDTDEIIYRDKGGYLGVKKIFLYNALNNCQSRQCYIYIPKNALVARTEDEETGEITFEFFKGITDKDEYSFWMDSDKKVLTAVFDSNGGSNVRDSSFHEGTQVKRPNNPSRSGYRFTGWFADKGCTEEFDFNTLVYNNIKLYAGWKKIENTSQTGGNSDTGSSSGEEDTNSGNQNNYNYSDNWKNAGNGEWQCFNKDGQKYIGYQEGLYWNGIKGSWYFDENGNMQTGWHEGKYFNESSNGYKGIEITNMNVVAYTQEREAAAVMGQYSYAITFVDDIDWKTKLHSSVKNQEKEIRSMIVGLWNTVTTDDWDVFQNIADAYMKDPASNKEFLADIVNEMFSTETWRTTWDGAKTLDYQVSLGSTAEGYINELWKNVEAGVGNDVDAALIEEKGWGALKNFLNSSEEIQKMFTDYSQNIAYLESIKASVSANSVLGEAIDTLIQEYKTQSEKSLIQVIANGLKIKEVDNGLTDIADIVTSDDALGEIGKKILDEVVGLKFGKADKIIQLAYKNSSNVSAVDKVVYSSYLRRDAIIALKNAEQKLYSQNSSASLEEYKNVFECARLITLTQYENMVKYYKSSSYSKKDKNVKISYLEREIVKLKEMTFMNYADKSSKAYYDYVATK